MKRDNFSFSTTLIIGDFLRPTGQKDNNTGEEKYIRYTEDQMNDEIDKVRKEKAMVRRKPTKRDSRNNTDCFRGFRLRLLKEKEKHRRDEQEQIKLQRKR